MRYERSRPESGGGRHELPDTELPAKLNHLWFFDGYGGWAERSVAEILAA